MESYNPGAPGARFTACEYGRLYPQKYCLAGTLLPGTHMRTLLFFSALLLSTVLSVGQSTKLEDITGLYSFIHSGETVQINVQPDHRVTGYVSHLADGESDRGQMLDMMFAKASLTADRLEFQTKKVHGAWFVFKGRVERGKAQTRNDEGYFLIKGTLTTYKEDLNGKAMPFASEVEFKSFPQGM
jgi:hypothetical protein